MAVIAPGALASLAALFIDPIPQDPNYHDFADQRVFFEIPHFGDVITNIGFMLAGSIALAQLLSPGRLSDAFATDRKRRAWIVAAAGAWALLIMRQRRSVVANAGTKSI